MPSISFVGTTLYGIETVGRCLGQDGQGTRGIDFRRCAQFDGGRFRLCLCLDTLDKYDYQQLAVEQTTNEAKFHATYGGAMQAIEELKAKFGGSQWFAHEKDDSFKSSIGQIYQTFGGQDLYPSVEEKAAMLLYLVTKNHSFSDGNKRIAATLFLWFMAGNE